MFGYPESQSVNNCVSNNLLPDATFPPEIQGTWGCQNETTPSPGGGLAAVEYLVGLQSKRTRSGKPNPGRSAGAATAADDAQPMRGRAEEPAVRLVTA